MASWKKLLGRRGSKPNMSDPAAGLITLRGKNEQGYEEYTLGKEPSVVLIRVPRGSFRMGSLPGIDTAFDEEKPDHEVMLSEFFIAKTQLTNEQYTRFETAQEPELEAAQAEARAV